MPDQWVRAYRVTLDNKHVLVSDVERDPLEFLVTLGFHSCHAALLLPIPAPTVGMLRLEAGYRGGVYRPLIEGDIAAVSRRRHADYVVVRRYVPMLGSPVARPVIDAATGLIGHVETDKGACRARMLLAADLVPGSVVNFPGGVTCRLVGIEHVGASKGQPWYTEMYGYVIDKGESDDTRG